MEEKLIDFKTAKLAKEVGCESELFTDEYCYEDEFGETFVCNYDPTDKPEKGEKFNIRRVVLCTQSLLQKWLREEHNIHIFIEPFWRSEEDTLDTKKEPFGYCPWVLYEQPDEPQPPEYFDTYEEALEEGLIEGLNLLVGKQ